MIDERVESQTAPWSAATQSRFICLHIGASLCLGWVSGGTTCPEKRPGSPETAQYEVLLIFKPPSAAVTESGNGEQQQWQRARSLSDRELCGTGPSVRKTHNGPATANTFTTTQDRNQAAGSNSDGLRESRLSSSYSRERGRVGRSGGRCYIPAPCAGNKQTQPGRTSRTSPAGCSRPTISSKLIYFTLLMNFAAVPLVRLGPRGSITGGNLMLVDPA